MSRYWYPARHSYQVSASTRKSLQQPVAGPSDDGGFPHAVHIPLAGLAASGQARLQPNGYRITVGMATCARAAGAQDLYRSLAERHWDGPTRVYSVGCLGACFAEPLVTVRSPAGEYYLFGNVTSGALWDIIKTAQGAMPSAGPWAVARERRPGVLASVADLDLVATVTTGVNNFFGPQVRRISGRCGLIDPRNLAEYVATGGYFALQRALFRWTPEQVRSSIAAAGLRGRGGAGFPTGLKLDRVAAAGDATRYVVANADEGDPGAYMDRALLESDPHAVLEGLLIAAYAVGAGSGYIVVRHEYALAVEVLRQAIADAQQAGLLGENILGSCFSFQLLLVESGGAFVCGEETALLQLLANNRGEPRERPPYPAVSGLNRHPVLVNNVETLANIAWIVAHGSESFRSIGTAASPGTKIFCLTGDVRRTGFVEVPLGTPADTLVETMGGARAEQVKAVQIGGPTGGVIAYHKFALDYETMLTVGAMMGSGGLVVLDQTRCMVDLARHLTGFLARESCGKCTVCRTGLLELESLLRALTLGRADAAILEQIAALCSTIQSLARCGLGRAAVTPALSTLRYFSSEYQAHVRQQCPAVMCRALIDFEIILPCRACRACYSVCPSGAVTLREGKKRFIVDRQVCTRCWACYEACLFNCIRIVSGGYLRKS